MTYSGMPGDRSRTAVARRWGRTATGAHYAEGRFATERRRARDGRLVSRLLAEQIARGGPAGARGARGNVSVHSTPRSARGAPFALVLDAPCGTGRLTGALAPLAGRLVSLDVSRAMLTAAPEAFGASARVEGDVFALPFGARTFDVAVACRLLHHFPAAADRRAALAELARVARRFVVVSYWDAASWHAWRRRAPGPLRRRGHDTRVAIAARELDADLAEAGLTRIARAHSLRFISPQTFVLAARPPE